MAKLHGNRVEMGTITTTDRDNLGDPPDGTILYNSSTGYMQLRGPSGWANIANASAPADKSDYPRPGPQGGSTTVFSTIWDGNPSNLPTSTGPSTWTAPATTTRARVVVIGGGAGHPSSYSSRGHGAYVDALIDITGGKKYKCIVGEHGNTGYAQGSQEGRGADGCGGSPGVDSNDTGTGGAGSAFFYADPTANSDNNMFPNGVLIAGAGGGGSAPTEGHAGTGSPESDTMGGFTGIFKGGNTANEMGEPGKVGGVGGRMKQSNNNFNSPNAARGEGGSTGSDGYSGNHSGGGGGGAGGGGAGGGPSNGTAEDAPDGRGWGYDSYNEPGAGKGGQYPMRGGNGFSFNGVNLGGGGGGSHGQCSGGGGWGGGAGAYYSDSGGAGGSGAWGYLNSEVTIGSLPQTGPPTISINGGSIGGSTPCPTAAGLEGNHGCIIIMT